ncbi:ACT domain-containing protein [Oceanicaulis alexandrii]|uniref:ACT domain-containing protein n=1 Tax=Oceanicaulis alexandrii TaxID=153233 RepID=UPI0035CF429A
MQPITDLDVLVRQLSPRLDPERYAYAAPPRSQMLDALSPIAVFEEAEGRSVIAPLKRLNDQGIEPVFICRRIILEVNSALEAVGLTAAVSQALAEAGVSANVVAALHHDHVFVPEDRAGEALSVLKRLSDRKSA